MQRAHRRGLHVEIFFFFTSPLCFSCMWFTHFDWFRFSYSIAIYHSSPLLSNSFLSFLYKLLVMTVFLVPNVYVFQMAPHALLPFSSIIVWIRPLQHFCYYLQHNGSASIVVMLFIFHTFPPTGFFYFTCFLLSGLLLDRQEVRISAELLTEMKIKLSQYIPWRHMGTGGLILLVLNHGRLLDVG